MRLKKIKLSTLDISKGKIDITDPCYNSQSIYTVRGLYIKPGIYNCSYYVCNGWSDEEYKSYVEMLKTFTDKLPKSKEEASKEDIGTCYIIELKIKGCKIANFSNRYKFIANVGVDSGMCGFFISDKPDFNDEEWEKFCNILKDDKEACVRKGLGFWSNSGIGDGVYDVFAATDKNKRICALQIRYIPFDDDDEME